MQNTIGVKKKKIDHHFNPNMHSRCKREDLGYKVNI